MNTLAEVITSWKSVRDGLDSVIHGQKDSKQQLLVCLLTGGHALLEGLPGTGKTLLALSAARLVGGRFRRIQFTPDLMPSDILGTNVFNVKTQEFDFRPGPVFTDILLADEINRTPPRTQAALLECMQEGASTIDGERRELSPIFTVLATQNPIEFEGTYPLPEAQRDRFLMKITLAYPTAEAEGGILTDYASGRRLHEAEVQSVLNPALCAASRDTVRRLVTVRKEIRDYIQALVAATRKDDAIHIGAGPRASIALLETSRTLAALSERDFVTPDDVKALGLPVLGHRLTLTAEAEMEGLAVADVLRRLFAAVEVPR
jgi:MoxR-like ATPase